MKNFTVLNQLQQVDLYLTWLPVSTESLVIALPQHKEVDHIGHVVIPEGQKVRKPDSAPLQLQ